MGALVDRFAQHCHTLDIDATGNDWLLPGEPPSELDDVGSLTIAAVS